LPLESDGGPSGGGEEDAGPTADAGELEPDAGAKTAPKSGCATTDGSFAFCCLLGLAGLGWRRRGRAS
jgi:hypothetical protein